MNQYPNPYMYRGKFQEDMSAGIGKALQGVLDWTGQGPGQTINALAPRPGSFGVGGSFPAPEVTPAKAMAAYNPDAMGDTTMQAAPTPQALASQTKAKPIAQPDMNAGVNTTPEAPKETMIEEQPRPYGASGAIQMEQKKQGNIDALIVALGEIGASLMGPYQNSWQAELGRSAAGMARSRVFASSMEKALAGEVPDDAGLALLTPEQQIQISQAVIQKQAMGLKEREVKAEETRTETQATEVKQTGAYQQETLRMSQKELDEKVRQFNIEAPIQKAESEARVEQYKSYAKAALDRVGVASDKAEDVYGKALDYVNAMGDAYKTMSPEEQGAFFLRVIDSVVKNDFSKLGSAEKSTPNTADWRKYKKR